MFVFVEETAGAVVSADAQVRMAAGSVIGWGSGLSGLALAMPRCGRCVL